MMSGVASSTCARFLLTPFVDYQFYLQSVLLELIQMLSWTVELVLMLYAFVHDDTYQISP